MHFRILPTIALLLSVCLQSCKKEDTLAINDPKTNLEANPFVIKMDKPSAQYKRQKRKLVADFYDKHWDKPNVNGGFLVAKNGQIIFENYNGYTHIEDKKRITALTPLHIASVSKVMTAAVILRLVDDQKLNLDQNIGTLLSPFPYEGITIRMLLNHRSGLPNYAYFTDDRSIWDHSKKLSNNDVLDLMNEHRFPLYFPADARFAYCNTNYVMLALVIEKITGLQYGKAMQELLFKPLKMNNTFVLGPEHDTDDVSQSYKANNLRLAFDHLDGTYGDKNIYSTPRDLLKFDLATYAPAFLSDKMKAEMYKGYSYEKKGIRNYGLGLRMFEWDTGQKLYFHNGWWHGNTAAYIRLVQDTVSIIALSNKYTRQTYKSIKLAAEFGDYPIKPDKEDGDE